MWRERSLPHEVLKEGGVEEEANEEMEEWMLMSGGSSKGKEKIYSTSLNSNSKFNSSMFKRNTYIHLPMENFGFRYHDKSRVVMHDNCEKMDYLA